VTLALVAAAGFLVFLVAMPESQAQDEPTRSGEGTETPMRDASVPMRELAAPSGR
jgi:hypothetical protein